MSAAVLLDEVVRARAPWSTVVPAGATLRIVDLGGNQAVDCVLHAAADHTERYSAPDTMVAQAAPPKLAAPGWPSRDRRRTRTDVAPLLTPPLATVVA